MKATLTCAILALPLAAHAQCLPADSNKFFASHPPVAACTPAPDPGAICLEIPRLVDATLHSLIMAASPDFRARPSAATIRSWPDQQPPGTLRVVDFAQRMDLTRRSAYVTCDGRHVYLHDIGGLGDKAEWYGPIPIEELKARKS